MLVVVVVVVFGQKWFYSGKRSCIWLKVVLFAQSGCTWAKGGCIRARWLYSGKLVVFCQGGFIRGKAVFIRAKWLYFDKVVVFVQKWLYSGKVVVFWQKWLGSCKVDESG